MGEEKITLYDSGKERTNRYQSAWRRTRWMTPQTARLPRCLTLMHRVRRVESIRGT